MSSRRELANAIRALSMDAVQKANSGHPGMPMGMADIAEVLWNDFLHHNPANPQWLNRDRFILSNGHGAMLQYALLHLAALFESFRDPLTVLISVPMSICGAMIFISLGVGGASLNIYTQVGLVTLIGLISKHGILIVQFANDLQKEGKSKREAIEMAATIRLRPILMTTAAMVLGVIPLITASGAGAVSRFNIGLVIATGISIGTLFTLFVVPTMYMFLAEQHKPEEQEGDPLIIEG